MKRIVLLAAGAATLSGCALFQGGAARTAAPAAEPAPEFGAAAATAALGARSASAAALDTTTAAEKAAALAAPAAPGERALGSVVVALGPPADQGMWLSSALVTATGPGRVVTASGQSLAVELRPGSGAALLSLAAFQALGLPLTGLPEVTVYGP